MRRITGWCAGLLGVIVLAAVTPASPAAGKPSGTTSHCDAPDDLVVNEWTGDGTPPGDVGSWTDDANWSRGKAPGPAALKQLVCIRTSTRIEIPAGTDLQVHVAAIDIAGDSNGPADVAVLRSNGLYVEASPKLVKSHLARGSRLSVTAGALGGRGLILAIGDVVLETEENETNVLTTRECGSVPTAGSCSTPPAPDKRVGTLQVTGGGRLMVTRGPTLVTDGYDVIVAGGQLLFQGSGRVVADNGTSLTLRRPSEATDESPPTVLFDNDGGWYAGADPFALPLTQVALNRAVIAKEAGDGSSSIQGDVTARNEVSAVVTAGSLAIAGNRLGEVTTTLQPSSAYTTGTCPLDRPTEGCLPEATPADVLVTSIKLPGSAGEADFTVEEKPAGTTALAAATKILAEGFVVSREAPALLEFRYDASVVGARTPATVDVLVRMEGGYESVSDCAASGTIPDGVARCVDRRAGQSRFEADGDLVVVVRTTRFSRFICR